MTLVEAEHSVLVYYQTFSVTFFELILKKCFLDCWVIMALHYLQTLSPPLITLPSLSPSQTANHETLGGLLYGFFKYFGYTFNTQTQVVSLLHFPLTKRHKGWDIETARWVRYLCVEDPMDPTRNLANSADYVSVHGIIEEFRRAACVLSGDGGLDVLCEPYNSSSTMMARSFTGSWNESVASTSQHRSCSGAIGSAPVSLS